MKQIIDGLIREHDGRRVPVILFTKGGGLWLESMADSGAEALGLDWTCDIGSARARVGAKVALQGNMDPAVLYANPPPSAPKWGASSLPTAGARPGVQPRPWRHPEVDPANAGAFFEAVHELSAQYHR